MRLRSAWVIALGVAGIALPAVVACRGVLGIHALGYDGGASDARDDVHEADAQETGDAPSGDDGASESGPSDTGVDTGHPVDTGADAPKDAGVDHEGDAHEAGPVDAGKDASKDAYTYDGCVNGCMVESGPNSVSALIANCPSPPASPSCNCHSLCDSVCGTGGSCSNPTDQTSACQSCIVECIRAGAGTGPGSNACGMALGECASTGACGNIGGCLRVCNP